MTKLVTKPTFVNPTVVVEHYTETGNFWMFVWRLIKTHLYK